MDSGRSANRNMRARSWQAVAERRMIHNFILPSAGNHSISTCFFFVSYNQSLVTFSQNGSHRPMWPWERISSSNFWWFRVVWGMWYYIALTQGECYFFFAVQFKPLNFIFMCRWTWVWVNSGSWWWTGRPGVLWFMGSQRVGHDWAAELNWKINRQYILVA